MRKESILLRKHKEFVKQLEKVEKLLANTDKLKNEIADLREKVISTHFEKIIRLAREHPEVPVDDFQKILGETVKSCQALVENYPPGENVQSPNYPPGENVQSPNYPPGENAQSPNYPPGENAQSPNYPSGENVQSPNCPSDENAQNFGKE